MLTSSRRPFRLAAFLVLLAAPQMLKSQQVKPAGVTRPRHGDGANMLFSRVDLAHAVGADSSNGHPWLWVATGALVGGVAGGVAAGVSASRTDDAMLVGPGITIVALVGAAAGGLVGGLAWLVSH